MNLNHTVRLLGFASLACLAAGSVAVQRADRQVRVESRNNRLVRYRTAIPANATVRLVDQLSSQACTRGRSWGYDRRGIWVSRGCRGIFEIDYRAGRGIGRSERYGTLWNGRWSNSWGSVGRVELGSDSNRRRSFALSGIRRVRLVDQLSDAPCRQGRTWGYTANRVWVDQGCRGIFEVTRR